MEAPAKPKSVADGASGLNTAEKPPTVILFLPGTMQAIFDQSLEVIVRQVEAALNLEDGSAGFLADGASEEIGIGRGRSIETCGIARRHDDRPSFVVMRADYTPLLSQSLEQSGLLLRFCRMLLFWIRVQPGIWRIVVGRSDVRHTRLSVLQKALLFVLGLSALVAFVATAQLMVDALSIPLPDKLLEKIGDAFPSWFHLPGGDWSYVSSIIAVLALLGLGLLSPQRISALFATGNEYYGVVGYLLFGDGRTEIREFFDDALQEITRRFPGSPIHLLCFSFGTVVAFDLLFPRNESKADLAQRISSLSFIGFPYALIEAGRPGYFHGRKLGAGADLPWQNICLEDDVLGSRIDFHRGEMFGKAAGSSREIIDWVVAPQLATKGSLNPFQTHMAYWDPDAESACQAAIETMRFITANADRAGSLK